MLAVDAAEAVTTEITPAAARRPHRRGAVYTAEIVAEDAWGGRQLVFEFHAALRRRHDRRRWRQTRADYTHRAEALRVEKDIKQLVVEQSLALNSGEVPGI